MCPLPVPTSENDPRVPGPLPNVDALFALYVELGFPKFGCEKGKLLPSRRSSKRTRSRICHHFASESCVHIRPGPSNVLRPRLPTVNAAGYANASNFRYGFCAAVGKRFGPKVQ